MGLFDKLLSKVTKAPEPTKTPEPRAKTKKVEKTAKEIATENGEPWVNILSVELDPENIGNGAFELDWNDIFLARLIKAGYQGKTDNDIVDRWFQDVCRNVVLENFEQWDANYATARRVESTDLGGGKRSVS